MSIIEKIKSSITAATALPFYYDTPQTLNLRLDTATYPCAMLHILQSGTIVDDNGIIRERLTIEMLFATTSSLDFDGLTVENNELDALKLKAFNWILSLYRSRDLRVVSLNGTNRYYATDDAVFSAYGVNITLEERAGVSYCDISEDEEDEEDEEDSEN